MADLAGERNGRNGGGLFGRLLGRLRGRGDGDWRESLEELIEEHQDDQDDETALGVEERRMLSNIIAVGDKRVDDVMIPRVDVVAVEIDTPIQDVVALYMEHPHSRLPVYRKNLDEVIGVLHIKDLVRFWGDTGHKDLTSIIRPPMIVPPSRLVLDLLLEMRVNRVHLALVVDEYGGIDGLVTMEDLVEEVIGDIRDEHDVDDDPDCRFLADGSIVAKARMEIDDFEARVGTDLVVDETDEEIDTLGGFIFITLGRVPHRGEIVRHNSGLEFEIAEADPRRIHRILIRRSNGQKLEDLAAAKTAGNSSS